MISDTKSDGHAQSLKRKRSLTDFGTNEIGDLSIETARILEGIECIIDTLDGAIPFPDINNDILSTIHLAIEEAMLQIPLYRIEVIEEANLPGILEAIMR